MSNDQHNRRHGLQPDMIVAMAAVVVGVCALGISLYQSVIMREQQRELSEQRRAEVWPYLEFGKGYANGSFRFIIGNVGIGPARMRSIRMTFDGEPVLAWKDLMTKVRPKGTYSYIQSHIGGRVLRPGDKIEALVVDGEMGDSLQQHVAQRLETIICYCSVYDDCWEYVENLAGGGSREPIDTCRVSPEDFKQ